MPKDTASSELSIDSDDEKGKRTSLKFAQDFYMKQGAAWVAREFMKSSEWKAIAETFPHYGLEQYSKLVPLLALAGMVSGTLFSQIERTEMVKDIGIYKHAFHTRMPREMSLVSKSLSEAITIYYKELDKGVAESKALEVAMKEFHRMLISNGLRLNLKDLLSSFMEQTSFGLFALKKTATHIVVTPILTVLNELYKECRDDKSKEGLIETSAKAFLKGIDASLFNITSFAEPVISREQMVGITVKNWIKYNQSHGLNSIKNEDAYNEWVRINEEKFLREKPDLTKRDIIRISFEEVHDYIEAHKEELRKKEILDEAAITIYKASKMGMEEVGSATASGARSSVSAGGVRRRFSRGT
jgi:hypothetical protein